MYNGYVEVVRLASGQRVATREVYTKSSPAVTIFQLGLCREYEVKVPTEGGRWKYKSFSNGARWPVFEVEWCRA